MTDVHGDVQLSRMLHDGLSNCLPAPLCHLIAGYAQTIFVCVSADVRRTCPSTVFVTRACQLRAHHLPEGVRLSDLSEAYTKYVLEFDQTMYCELRVLVNVYSEPRMLSLQDRIADTVLLWYSADAEDESVVLVRRCTVLAGTKLCIAVSGK